MRHGVDKGSANLATTSFVGLSTSLIVKHGVSDCTPQVISGPETTLACWLMSCFKDAELISKISFDDPLANAVKMTHLDDTRVRVLSIWIETWTKYNGSGEN